jgi:putative exporter of polyketide antibiotics
VARSIRAKGDKNKMAISALALRSADYGGRATPSGRHAWGVFVMTKTHLAFGKITRFYQQLHQRILG